ncbi:MAG: hypothetical protein IT430_19990 [Phycisphaerales bacterium]|nr:hypothetical protein [Phycisphaerales bacterium]
MTPIFKTNPHGVHEVLVGDPASEEERGLVTIREGDREMTFTAEEMTNLAIQWLGYTHGYEWTGSGLVPRRTR